MKKILFLFMLLLFGFSVTACKSHKKDIKLNDVTYADLETIYEKDYYRLLPDSLYDETMINHFNEVDFTTLTKNMIKGDYEFPVSSVIPVESLTSQDMTAMTLSNLQDSVGTSGPVDILYGNLAAFQSILGLLDNMNQEFSKYGEIKFDGREITIPSSALPEMKDPLDDDKNLTWNDVTATFTTEDHVSHIVITTENDYFHLDNMQYLDGTISLNLDVALSKDENNLVKMDLSFYLNSQLDVEAKITDRNASDTATLEYNIGLKIESVEDKSLKIISQLDTNMNLLFATNEFLGTNLPDIDEDVSTRSAFVLNKTDDGVVTDYVLSSNMFDTVLLDYHLTADNDNIVVYVDGNVSDEDFYGQNIPTQRLKGVFVYNNQNELVFTGGNVLYHVPQYDANGNFLDEITYQYSGYFYNMQALNGFTDIRQTASGIYEVYNGDTVILNENAQQGDYSDEQLIEKEQILAGNILNHSYAAYCHVKAGETLSLSLPNGLSSPIEDVIKTAYQNLPDFTEHMVIDLEDEAYQVPPQNTDVSE